MTKVPYPPSTLNIGGLTTDNLQQIAFKTGFSKRFSGKVSAPVLFKYLCEESVKGTVSHNDLAAKIQSTTGIMASRQAYWERINNDFCATFFQTALAEIMLSKLNLNQLDWLKSGGLFKRLLIQDSTVIQLPAKLFAIFSGVKNATTTACNARIQSAYDLCSGQFIKFSIDPYSKNDLSVAAEIPVESGDLLLRDRGYFRLDTIYDFKNKGVDTISRYKHKTALYDFNTQEKINLLPLLTREGSLDMIVLAGENKNIKLRLLATPVPEEVANLRRMKAKRENKTIPSQELLSLMSWSIFIVTIENKALTINHVLALYGLRWRIENFFKTWKSNFSFAQLHTVSLKQLQVLLTARFIMIMIFYQNSYAPLSHEISRRFNKQLSLMKLMRYIQKNFACLPMLVNPHRWSSSFLDAITRYCTYDKRKRPNFVANLNDILMELSQLVPLGVKPK